MTGPLGRMLSALRRERAGREEIERLAGEQAALRRVATLVARAAAPEEIFAAVAEELATPRAARGPKRARDACTWLVRDNADRGISLGIRLLADLRGIFGDDRAMTTEDILTRLHALDAAPWADLKGQPLDARGLSRLLAPYDVNPAKVKVSGRSRRPRDLAQEQWRAVPWVRAGTR